MGHNSVISGHPKSLGNPWVDGLSTGPPDLGRHICPLIVLLTITHHTSNPSTILRAVS